MALVLFIFLGPLFFSDPFNFFWVIFFWTYLNNYFESF